MLTHFTTIMGRAAAQAAAVLMARVMEVAVLTPASRATKVIRVVIIKVIGVVIIKVIRAVIINNLAKGVRNNSLDNKVIRSS